jgi:sugar transferase (PEP-CTERM/EpsH1 system associated)
MNRPLHVCHVLLSLRPGGLENGVVNVVNGLDPALLRSSVCCLQQGGEFAARIHNGTEVAAMGLKPGNDFRLPWRLARLFRAWRVDIVHTRNAESFFYGLLAARLARVPVVIHSEHGRTFPEKPLRARIQRWMLSNVNAAFAVSQRLKEDLVRELGVSPGRFEVLYNGVDLDRFGSPSTAADSRAARRDVVIGSVGRLVPVKNYSLLLQAMARLPAGPASRLVLVGDGPERPLLENLTAALGLRNRVQFAGHREDVPRLLQEMDIFVLPSTSEGMSNTLLEAMAAGVTAVASDVGGNSEIIENEVSGLLFRSGDIAHAAQQLRRLISEPALRARLAGAAAARVRDEFSIDAMLLRYTKLYTRIWSEANAEPLSSVAY